MKKMVPFIPFKKTNRTHFHEKLIYRSFQRWTNKTRKQIRIYNQISRHFRKASLKSNSEMHRKVPHIWIHHSRLKYSGALVKIRLYVGNTSKRCINSVAKRVTLVNNFIFLAKFGKKKLRPELYASTYFFIIYAIKLENVWTIKGIWCA